MRRAFVCPLSPPSVRLPVMLGSQADRQGMSQRRSGAFVSYIDRKHKTLDRQTDRQMDARPAEKSFDGSLQFRSVL